MTSRAATSPREEPGSAGSSDGNAGTLVEAEAVRHSVDLLFLRWKGCPCLQEAAEMSGGPIPDVRLQAAASRPGRRGRRAAPRTSWRPSGARADRGEEVTPAASLGTSAASIPPRRAERGRESAWSRRDLVREAGADAPARRWNSHRQTRPAPRGVRPRTVAGSRPERRWFRACHRVDRLQSQVRLPAVC